MDLDSDAILDADSALVYARYYGLCVDYASDDSNFRDFIAPSDDELDRDIWHLSKPISADKITELTKERLAVNRDAALLLKAVHLLQAAPAAGPSTIDRRKWMLSLRQEVPVLSTDHELDVLRFGKVTTPDLGNLRIPSEVTDQEKDEGFEWPSRYFAYPAQCEEQVRGEKLGVTKEALQFLQDTICGNERSEDSEELIAAEQYHKPNAVPRPITPPLLPLSPVLSPYIPSSPANRLPLASDSSESVVAEARALEQQIMNADSLRREGSSSSDSMLLDIIDPQHFSPLSEYKEPTAMKRIAENLKVEGPLTPPMFSTSPMKKLKSVSFTEILAEYIPSMNLADTIDGEDNSSVDFDDYDDVLREIEPLAAEAKRKIENEKLSCADTTARVDIPDLDFTLPVAPWHTYSLSNSGRHRASETELDAQSSFILRMKREDLKSATSWHGVSALERQLQWSIFTTPVSSIDLEEKLHGETELNKAIAELTTGTIAVSSSLVWKPNGLRILDEEEEEQEIEEGEAEEQRDMEALVRKRKLEMEDEAAEQVCKRSTMQWDAEYSQKESIENQHWVNNLLSVRHKPQKGRSKTTHCDEIRLQAPASRHKSTQPSKDTDNELMFGGFSASTALHRFMVTRGKPIQSTSTAQTQHSSIKATTQTLPVRSREPSLEVPANETPNASTHSIPGEKTKDSHLIPLPERLRPCSFIVSSILLQRRSLLKQIESLYPNAEILYRDYTLPHSPSQEADMILSPSTGLIFTTLQQVKQRALPGQASRSPLKERILALGTRYERLFVMVSEGLPREMEERESSRPRDSRDEEALMQLEVFVGKIEGDVQAKFLRGGEAAFARGVVGSMAEFGLEYGSVDIKDTKLLAVETSWEIFLRRAGLNPFAAQLLVASLTQRMHIPIPPSLGSASAAVEYNTTMTTTVQVYGLPAFLIMGEDERIRRFQAMMGGRRVLGRVGRLLDQRWISAAHGFRVE
ncbi:hypothetical protein J1614_001144 [Plenodomus biglobosus]|nr:hypothetical protein J1614_001144 [Plenodomus biglobosus]